VILTGGEVSDVKGYAPLMAEPGPEAKVLMGDKGYDADAILNTLRGSLWQEGAIARIDNLLKPLWLSGLETAYSARYLYRLVRRSKKN